MNKLSQYLLSLMVISLLVFSCNDDEPKPAENEVSEGFYVINEGAFGGGNASLSYFDRETQTVTNDIFNTVNGIPLGDQAQSMTIHGENGYIVVQNSALVHVIDLQSHELIATIDDGLESPRFFLGISDSKGYVSDWGSDGLTGTIRVIDLESFEVTNTIETGSGTNRLILNGTDVFAVNAGGWGRDNTVVVIDSESDAVTNEITILDNPNGIVSDANGDLWVSAAGYTAYDESFNVVEEESTPGGIIKLSSDGTVSDTYAFETLQGVSSLSVSPEGDVLYFLSSGQLFQMNVSDQSLPENSLSDAFFYGFGVDPETGNVVGCEAPDFSSNGNIKILSADGMLLDTYEVGIGPNGCAF